MLVTAVELPGHCHWPDVAGFNGGGRGEVRGCNGSNSGLGTVDGDGGNGRGGDIGVFARDPGSGGGSGKVN